MIDVYAITPENLTTWVADNKIPDDATIVLLLPEKATEVAEAFKAAASCGELVAVVTVPSAPRDY